MRAIYKRELKAFFNTMIGWIFIAALLFITGIYFLAINIMNGYASVAYTISSSVFIYIIAIPILTMRILSEEKKQKIDQLIFTAPVSIGKVVLGKYLSMCTILAVPVLVICTYPAVLALYGTISFAEAYTSILGFFLYGLAAIAVGLFISSLTESIVIAAVVSFAAMFLTYIMRGLTGILSANTGKLVTALCKVLGCVDFESRFEELLNGVLDIRAILYFVIVIAVFLFLTTQIIQKRRFTVSKNTFGVGAYSSSMVLVVVVAAVIANLLVAEIPDKYMAIDVTSQKLYSISDETKEMLANLDKDVNLYVIQAEESKDEVIDKLIRQYAENSSHITYEYKDPVKYPSFYKQYSASGMSYNSVIVECGDKYRIVDTNSIYVQEIDYNTYSYVTTGFDGEGQLTSAINYVATDNNPKAYNIVGHGESSIGANFTDAIDKLNVEMSDIHLMNYDAIPEDAEFVMIAAPESDYSEDDVDKLLAYVKNGGNLYICTSYAMDDPAGELPNFQKLLDAFNVTIIPGSVIETDRSYFYQSATYLLPEVEYSDLTSGVYQQKYIFEPYAQAITVDETEDGITVEKLLSSSSNAYTSSNSGAVNQDAPFNLGSYITKDFDGNTASLMIFTSINMLTDDADTMVSKANSTLFGNCIAKFVPTDIGNVSIPVKEYNNDYLTVNTGTGMLIGIIYSIITPLVLIVAGFVIWFRRRKK